MFFIDKIRQKISGTQGLGVLKPDEPDHRDLKVGFLGWGRYEPKYDRREIETVSIKNQAPFNTCTFESVICQKEPMENETLSVRSLVIYAKDEGYISGDGFSTLRKSQKALQKFGALPYGVLNEREERGWTLFSEMNLNKELIQEAKENRSGSYWRIDDIDEVYKALDENDIIQTAMYWYSGYNMSGGLRAPWILQRGKGYRVGAHAVSIIGYDRNYHGQDVFICQNSYGNNWGDNGKFYITRDHLERALNIFGAMLQKDIDAEVGKTLRDYRGKNVKVEGEPAIYKIENGQKRHYQSWEAFVEHGAKQGYENISKQILESIPEGEPINK